MSEILWPASICPSAADYSVKYDVQINVMRSGRVDTYGLPGARWEVTLTLPADYDLGRAKIESTIVSLRGGARRLRMGHFGRPIPNGSLRGLPTLGAPTSIGANTITLANANGNLKAGDILGLGTQLLMVEEDADPSGGNMTVKVSPCVRSVYSVGTAVVWDRPTCLWIPQEPVIFPYLPVVRPSFSIKLVEAG